MYEYDGFVEGDWYDPRVLIGSDITIQKMKHTYISFKDAR